MLKVACDMPVSAKTEINKRSAVKSTVPFLAIFFGAQKRRARRAIHAEMLKIGPTASAPKRLAANVELA